jgi:GT2 family glycosyltransferase
MDPLDATEILVVIVNYRTPGLTVDCLASLEPERAGWSGVAVTVVEGGSGDDSAERIGRAIAERGWGGWVELLPLERNGGFAYANNRAIERVLGGARPPRYVWLLNPDTVVRPGAMQTLHQFLEAHPEVGIAGSRLENEDGSPRTYAFRFPSVLGEFEATARLGVVSRLLAGRTTRMAPPVAPCRVDWVSGGSMMVRRAVFEAIGLMDDRYFLYYEESDFCLRAARAGWPAWHVPESRVVHLAGQSTGVRMDRQTLKRRPAYWFESRHRYFRGNHGPFVAALADLAWLAGNGLNVTRRLLTGQRDQLTPRLIRDFLQNSGRLWLRRL